MNKGRTTSFIFGILFGGAIMYHFVEKKYKRIADEEIQSVKDTFQKNMQDFRDETIKKSNDKKLNPKNDWDYGPVETDPDYECAVNNLGYVSYSDSEKEGRKMTVPKPYVISPEKFGEEDDYDEVTLTYYADKVLTDEDDDVIEDIDELIGKESLNKFGVYEDDAIYVRNEARRCDYEICLDEREFYAAKYNRYGDLF